jgi:asparagine synthase (glutamine-hydrolysing)
MSAIAGLVWREDPVSRAAGLRGMLAALAHRPHAGEASRSAGAASFGIQWSSTGSGPATSEPLTGAGGVLITGDVRLDNRDELIRVLEANESAADETLVLRAYERWGAACPEHLVGDFAFAVWDESRQTLLCARDPLGMKPLFYAVRGQVLAFGSEIRALLALPDIQRALNPEMARDHLLGLPGDGRQTLYRGVFRVPAAHVAVLAPDRAPSLREYWRLDPERELPAGTESDYTDTFRSAFVNAVRSRMRGATPIGATLSGGLDSSAVACVARDLLGGTAPVHAFSGRFPVVPECDEGPFIESVREQGGLVAHDVPGDLVGPLAELELLAEHLDEPCLVQNVHLWSGVFRAASAHGVRVVLDGHDGDTAISHDVDRTATGSARPATLRSLARSLLNRSIALRRAWERLRRSQAEKPEAIRLMETDFARATDAAERWDRYHRADTDAASAGGRSLHLRRLTSGFTGYASETVGRLGAAFGVEPRHPFYDQRLLELCLALPGRLKRRDGLSRYVLREALAGVLPERVRQRRDKTSLGPQFHRGFRTSDRERLAGLFRESRSLLEPFVDPGRLEELRRRYIEGQSDQASVVLWGVASFAVWLRRSGITG